MILFYILVLALLPALNLCASKVWGQYFSNQFAKAMSLLMLLAVIAVHFVIPNGYAFQIPAPVLSGMHFEFTLMFDTLTWVMLMLVGFINLVIQSYSARYLLTDMNQPRFMGQLSFLTFAVMLLILSGSLFTAFIAWQFIGLSLYLLLNHYHYDRKANKAAKKKFMINRVGDCCFLVAVVLAYQTYGSTQFATLFHGQGASSSLILSLVFVAIMTKSAQFPFYIWLIDTMEAPTPVSAMMHAGVINAGGFLLARLSPWYEGHSDLMWFIVTIGAITAFLGNTFMRTQPDVKKQLAYSTMGQMGFMIMQCGLGCFALAVFHLITHGFFKANLFLTAGSTLNQHQRPKPQNRIAAKLLSALIAALVSVAGYVLVTKGLHDHINLLLLFFAGLSVYGLVLNLSATLKTVKARLVGFVMLLAIVLIYGWLTLHFELLTGHVIANTHNVTMTVIGLVVVVILVSFVFAKSILCPQQRYPLWARFCYHKGGLEGIYRQYILNKIRGLGEIIRGVFDRFPVWARVLVVSGLIFWFLDTFIYFVVVHPAHAQSVILTMVAINLALLCVVLLVANRAKTLPEVYVAIAVCVVGFSSLAAVLDQTATDLIGVYQAINGGVLLLAWGVLFMKRDGTRPLRVQVNNRLPWCHVYMSVILMMLIGIPGSSSFISELCLFWGLIDLNPILAIAFAGAMLLLSLVVLHALQEHFFNPKAIQQYAVSLSPAVHVLCLSVIGVNLFNGIFPSYLLQMIHQFLGV